jgi:hypothetical protein
MGNRPREADSSSSGEDEIIERSGSEFSVLLV